MENLAQWYPKLDAARRLGISERTLERRIQEGLIQVRKRPADGKRQPELVCNPDDVDKLQPAAHAVEPGAIARVQTGAALAPLADIVSALRALPGPPTRKEWRLWLTIEQAAEYSGLTERQIRALVRAGELSAVRRPLRVRRASLDSFDTCRTGGAAAGWTRGGLLDSPGGL